MLQDFVKAELLPHKYPREIKFIDDLPKTGTGKIDRQGGDEDAAPLLFNKLTVVPAKAGTHNHKCPLLRWIAAPAFA